MTRSGGVRPQAIRSFIPLEMVPQAVLRAWVSASSRVAAEAVALSVAPRKVTTAVHSACWLVMVEVKSTTAMTAAAASVRSVARDTRYLPRRLPISAGSRDTIHIPTPTATAVPVEVRPMTFTPSPIRKKIQSWNKSK